MSSNSSTDFSPGLEGVVAVETEIAEPDREGGVLRYRGIDIEDVTLEIHGRQLVISGERRAQEAEGRLYQQIEIAHGPFRRVVELGAEVVAERAAATYEDGVLRIDIPLVQKGESGRRIPIEREASERS